MEGPTPSNLTRTPTATTMPLFHALSSGSDQCQELTIGVDSPAPLDTTNNTIFTSTTHSQPHNFHFISPPSMSAHEPVTSSPTNKQPQGNSNSNSNSSSSNSQLPPLTGGVFLTGATGFIGSVLLEQILRLYPAVQLCLLLRQKRNEPPELRLKQLFKTQLFDLLYQQMKLEEEKKQVIAAHRDERSTQTESDASDGAASSSKLEGGDVHISSSESNCAVEASTPDLTFSRSEFCDRLCTRCHIIDGNLFQSPSSLTPLGLSEEDYSYIQKHTQFYIHVAASISFTNSLYDALIINYFATKQLLELASQSKNTKSFMYVSTAYVNGWMAKGETVDERIYDTPIIDPRTNKPHTLFQIEEWVNFILKQGELCKLNQSTLYGQGLDSKLKSFERDVLHFWNFPNTYTLTKWLTERFIEGFQRRRLEEAQSHFNNQTARPQGTADESALDTTFAPNLFPVTLFRPSIVGCISIEGPLPCFIGNKSGAAGIHLVIGHNIMKQTGNNPNQHIDIIPVDMVTAGMMLIIERDHYLYEERKKLQSSQPLSLTPTPLQPPQFHSYFRIYHSTLGDVKPLPNTVYVGACEEFYTQHPTKFALKNHRRGICGTRKRTPIQIHLQWTNEHSWSYKVQLFCILLPYYLKLFFVNLFGSSKSRYQLRSGIEVIQMAHTTRYDFGLTFRSENMKQLIKSMEQRYMRYQSKQDGKSPYASPKSVNRQLGGPPQSTPSELEAFTAARVLARFPSLVYCLTGMPDWSEYMRELCLGEQIFLCRETRPELRDMLGQKFEQAPLWKKLKQEQDELKDFKQSCMKLNRTASHSINKHDAHSVHLIVTRSNESILQSSTPTTAMPSPTSSTPTLSTRVRDNEVTNEMMELTSLRLPTLAEGTSTQLVSHQALRINIDALVEQKETIDSDGSEVLGDVDLLSEQDERRTSVLAIPLKSASVTRGNSVDFPNHFLDVDNGDKYLNQLYDISTGMEPEGESVFDIEDLGSTKVEHIPTTQCDPITTRRMCVVENLCFEYHGASHQQQQPRPTNSRLALDGINFTLQTGHFLCVAGNSRSGKSTLVNLLLDQSFKMIHGRLVAGKIEIDPSHAGLTSTDAIIASSVLTVDENLIQTAQYHNSSMDLLFAPLGLQSSRLLASLNIPHLSDRYVGGMFNRGLSTGEAKRVQVGRAMATRSQVLILDDPLVGLDSHHARELLELLAHMCQADQLTIIITIQQFDLHSPIFDHCSHLLLLEGGQQVYFGPADPRQLKQYSETHLKFTWNEQGNYVPTAINESDHLQLPAIDANLLGPPRSTSLYHHSDPSVNATITSTDVLNHQITATTGTVHFNSIYTQSSLHRITKRQLPASGTKSSSIPTCSNIDLIKVQVNSPVTWFHGFKLLLINFVLIYRRDLRLLYTQMILMGSFAFLLGLLLLQLSTSITNLQSLNSNVIWTAAAASIVVVFSGFAILEEHQDLRWCMRQQSYTLSQWFLAQVVVQIPTAFAVILPCIVCSFFLSGFPPQAFMPVYCTFVICYLIGRLISSLICLFVTSPVNALLISEGVLVSSIAFVGGLISVSHWPTYLHWFANIDFFYHAGNIVLYSILSDRLFTCQLVEDGFGFMGQPNKCQVPAYGTFQCQTITEYIHCQIDGGEVLEVAFGIHPSFNRAHAFGYLILTYAILQSILFLSMTFHVNIIKSVSMIKYRNSSTNSAITCAPIIPTLKTHQAIEDAEQPTDIPITLDSSNQSAKDFSHERTNSGFGADFGIQFYFHRVTLLPSSLSRLNHILLQSPVISQLLGYPFIMCNPYESTASTAASHSKIVLRECTSYFELGSTIGIMGVSGSGKTTLLNSLAGMLTSNEATISGTGIHFTKRPTKLLDTDESTCQDDAIESSHDHLLNTNVRVQYVQQDEPYEPVLTVWETVYSTAATYAQLQLHGFRSTIEWCQYLIKMLQLTKVHNMPLSSLTHSDRLRVSITAALTTTPNLLLLDEPLSHISSSDGLQLLTIVSSHCKQYGICCVFTLHQPNAELFHLTNQLIFMHQGEQVFDGTPTQFQEYCRENYQRWTNRKGQPRSITKQLLKLKATHNHNRSLTPVTLSLSDRTIADWCDFFLNLLMTSSRRAHIYVHTKNGGIETRSHPLVGTALDKNSTRLDFVMEWNQWAQLLQIKRYHQFEKDLIREMKQDHSDIAPSKINSVGDTNDQTETISDNPNNVNQLMDESSDFPGLCLRTSKHVRTLFYTMCLIYARSPPLFWNKLSTLILSGLWVGAVYPFLGAGTEYIREYLSVINFLLVFGMFSMIVVVTPMNQQSIVFRHHQRNQRFQVMEYFIATTMVAMGACMIMVMVFTAIFYFLVGFQTAPGNFFLFMLVFFLVCFCLDSLCTVIGFLVPSSLVASILSATIMTIFAVFDGFYIQFTAMPRWMLFISYLSPARYAYEVLAHTELIGQTYISNATKIPVGTVDGGFIFKVLINDQPNYNIGLDLSALGLYILTLRIIFLIILYTKVTQPQTQTNSSRPTKNITSSLKNIFRATSVLAIAVCTFLLIYYSGSSISSTSTGSILLPRSSQIKDYVSLPQSSTVDTKVRTETLHFFQSEMTINTRLDGALTKTAGGTLGQASGSGEYGPIKSLIYFGASKVLNDSVSIIFNETTNFATLHDFAQLYDNLTSLAPVPLGITNYRSDRLFAKSALASNFVQLLHYDDLSTIFPDWQLYHGEFNQVLARNNQSTTFMDELLGQRLYSIDHLILANYTLQTNRFGAGVLGIFYIDSSTQLLAPLSLLLVTPTSRVCYTPLDDSDGYFDWTMAKMAFNLADAYRISLRHFVEQHVIWEPLRTTLHRQLHESHPVSRLIAHHLKNLYGISIAGLSDLFNGGAGIFFLCFAYDFDSFLNREVAHWIEVFDLNKVMLKKDLELREVQNLPGYLYREDAQANQHNIYLFVQEYLMQYYQDASDLINDRELQNMFKELYQTQPIAGIPFSMASVPQLIDLVTHLIWSSSVQHHSRNLYSFWHMRFVLPMAPLSLYQPLPTYKPAIQNETQLVKYLPDRMGILNQITLALAFFMPISPSDRLGYSYQSAGLGLSSSDMIQRFINRCEELSIQIQKRNLLEGDQPYVFNDPQYLPYNLVIR